MQYSYWAWKPILPNEQILGEPFCLKALGKKVTYNFLEDLSSKQQLECNSIHIPAVFLSDI